MRVPHFHRWERGTDAIGLYWRRCTFRWCDRYELWAYGDWNRAAAEPTFEPYSVIHPKRPNPAD